MNRNEIIANVISGLAVALLIAITRLLYKVQRDFHRFMTEHTWLLATSLWTRDKVYMIMAKLDMPVTESPPEDLPWKGKHQQ